MGNIDKFDFVAETYDTDERIQISNIVADAIRGTLVDSKNKASIDFGCGTGLVGINLASEFKSILFMDASQNMIEKVSRKLEDIKIDNAKVFCYDLELGEVPDIKSDYIFMVNVLLHIKDFAHILHKLKNLLNNEGHLIIVDFDKNTEVESTLVHNGFKQEELKSFLSSIGYKDIKSRTFYSGRSIFMGKDASLFILDSKIQI